MSIRSTDATSVDEQSWVNSASVLMLRWLANPKEQPPPTPVTVSQLQFAPFTQVPSVHSGTQSMKSL